MKYIIVAIFCITFAIADEMDRMESIIVDIENLRLDYSQCMKKLDMKNMKQTIVGTNLNHKEKLDLEKKTQLLDEYKILLDKERDKNALLIDEVGLLTKEILNNKKSNKNKIDSLKIKEKEDKISNMEDINNLKSKYEKIVKNKNKTILSLKNQIKSRKKTKEKKQEICKDDNPFPELMMKNTREKKVDKNHNVEKTLKLKRGFKAATYRLNKKSDIYNDVDGKVLFSWENKTSFTSANMTQNWLEVSGYFIDGKLKKAQKSLWVKKVNATKR